MRVAVGGTEVGTVAWAEAPVIRRRRLVALYGALAGALTLVVSTAPQFLAHHRGPHRPHMFAGGLVGGWTHWDGWWYLAIARHGYTYQPHHMTAVAFFPVYPLLVRLLAPVADGEATAAVVITLVCGCAALLLFERWCAVRMTSRQARLAVLALALYPFSWFLYGATYSDALYLVLVLCAFLLLESDRVLAAGLVGAVATATRPTGITLVIGLAAVLAERRGWIGRRAPRRAPQRRDLGLLVSMTGLVAWCLWLDWRFGRPLAFVEAEGAPGWNQAPGLHTWLKLSFPHALQVASWPVDASLVVQAVGCAAFLLCVPAVVRRFGIGYGTYVVAAVIVPAASTAEFLGVGRYLIPAFPVFALAGIELTRSVTVRRIAATVSTTALVAGAAFFASGFLMS